MWNRRKQPHIAVLSWCCADSDKAKPGELEFVKTKDVKLQDRKWAQEQAGPSKATRPRVGSLPLHLKLVVIACSTLGLLLFGYRMYQQHYSPKPKQYVRTVHCLLPFLCLTKSLLQDLSVHFKVCKNTPVTRMHMSFAYTSLEFKGTGAGANRRRRRLAQARCLLYLMIHWKAMQP
jgi:hypothetical protein